MVIRSKKKVYRTVTNKKNKSKRGKSKKERTRKTTSSGGSFNKRD